VRRKPVEFTLAVPIEPVELIFKLRTGRRITVRQIEVGASGDLETTELAKWPEWGIKSRLRHRSRRSAMGVESRL
jgi:hypothetical protein